MRSPRRPPRRFWDFSDGLYQASERNRKGSVMVDTVLNHLMNPVFAKEPVEVRRRLQHPYSETWESVLIGETKQVVSIPEYLYREKYDMVVGTLTEMLEKKDLAMYKRDPARLQAYVERTARKLIERILDEK